MSRVLDLVAAKWLISAKGEARMHERTKVEIELCQEAERISAAHNGAPVIVILAGSAEAGVNRTMLGSTLHAGYRLRDLLGLLETAKQIETLKHFSVGSFAPKMPRSGMSPSPDLG